MPARRLSWPARNREPGASLHAKVLVVDRSVVLVGSANLTGAAMERKLECGLLRRGGPQPAQICEHIESLYGLGILRLSADPPPAGRAWPSTATSSGTVDIAAPG